jgi:hypothetical protein
MLKRIKPNQIIMNSATLMRSKVCQSATLLISFC